MIVMKVNATKQRIRMDQSCCCATTAKKVSEIAKTTKSEITEFQYRFTSSMVLKQRTENNILLTRNKQVMMTTT
jgi:hypothetical protein